VCAACGGGGGGDGPTFSSDHPRIFLNSQDVRARLTAELASGSTSAKKFKSMIDNWVAGDDTYGVEGWQAALMGQLTGDPKYCAAAVKFVDGEVSAEQGLIQAGKTPQVAGDDYLDVGPMIGDVALTYDWCNKEVGDKRAAWLAYANQAVFNVWNFETAKWGTKELAWVGWAVDDPSDNYYYSFLRATMLLGLAAHDEIPDAAKWLTEFHDTKLTGELVPTFNSDLVGGGSREGTGYGVSMRELFHLYDLWHESTGEVVDTLTPHTRASMLTAMHQMVPTLDYFAPTGDQSSRSAAPFFDYNRNYIQELISLYPTDPVAPAAQALLAQSSLPEMANQFMYVFDFLYENKDVSVGALDSVNTAYYAPGIGEVYARASWDKPATWVNMIAGPYTEGHAHQDQGSIMIYKEGWLAYDAVVDSQSGLTQDTTSHSVVRLVDGNNKAVEQQTADATDTGPTSKLVALHQGDGYVYTVADVTPVYGSKSIAQNVQREMVYLQPDVVVVYDRVQTKSGSQVWQLVTPKAPNISGDPNATMKGDNHTLNVTKILGGKMAQTSLAALDPDFSSGFRIDETVPAGDNRFLHVISVDGAASAAAASGADGVTFTMGGQTVVVQFSHASVGATLTIGSGAPITLATGVDTLKETK
jgi:hypothetical protein